MKRNALLWIAALPLALGLVAFKTDLFEINKQLDIFISVYKDIHQLYVDPVSPSKTMDRAIEAMLEDLDPYTVYIPEDDIEDYRMATTGEYGGIGIGIRERSGQIMVDYVAQGFSVDKAGICPGDILLKVDNQSAKGRTVDEVSEWMMGNPGTDLQVVVERDGKAKTLKLKRERIATPAVTYSGFLQGTKVGYIYLTSFLPGCAAEVQKAIEKLQSEGMEQLVLDLRGNPGGLLDESVQLVNLFVPRGVKVVSTEGKDPSKNSVLVTQGNPIAPQLPLVILINHSSASASEIVAGTLQDLDRAVLIGQRSFGKGLVQETRPLPYGTSLKVTIAKYYTHSGRCIQAINYAERNPDGSVSRIPDSLRTTFQTVGGRTVYDGGGIDPDVVLDDRSYSDVLFALAEADAFFDFANAYRKENKAPESVDAFKVSDAVFNQFKKRASSSDVEYKTATEEILDELKRAAEYEKYLADLPSYDQLKKEFLKAKEQDIDRNAAEIRQFLAEEIISRYFYDAGRLAYGLEDDDGTAKALELIQQNKLTDIHKPKQ